MDFLLLACSINQMKGERITVTEKTYRFFPGCIASAKLPFIEKCSRDLIGAVGIPVVDDQRFTCCPDPVVFRSASREEWFQKAKRNLLLDGADPILTLCPGCKSTLAEVGDMLRSGKGIGAIDYQVSNIPSVFHILEILSDDLFLTKIGGLIKRELTSLRIGLHYGCHLLKPSETVRFDDPDMPTSLRRIVEILGATVVDYEEMLLCCGRPSLDDKTSLDVLKCKLSSMAEAGCNIVVVACPFCFEQFDLGQIRLKGTGDWKSELPVVYFAQLVLLAIGKDGKACGLDLHRIKPNVLLE